MNAEPPELTRGSETRGVRKSNSYATSGPATWQCAQLPQIHWGWGCHLLFFKSSVQILSLDAIPAQQIHQGSRDRRERYALANVFSSQDDSAGLALEAADMPLFLEGQQRLALLDLLFATCTL